MKIEIRPYEAVDFEMICKWWEHYLEPAPLYGMMVTDGTFVLELGKEPIMTLTALRTQSPQISYLEGFCAKPGLEKPIRNECAQALFDHSIRYLSERGFVRVLILTDKISLVHRYQDLGMGIAHPGYTILGRDL
jgi:hypothetical protein